MTVINISKAHFKLYLTKYEVEKYFSGYENLIFLDRKTKETLLLLLRIAANNLTAEKVQNADVTIYPTSNGGCLLNVTFDDETIKTNKNVKLRQRTITYIFSFENFENIISLSSAYKKICKAICKNSIYCINSRYFLIIEIPEFDQKTPMLISEYALFSARGKIFKEIITEYGKCIAEENAIEILLKEFKVP